MCFKWKPPYPEEKFNKDIPVDVDTAFAMTCWMLKYGVPPNYQNFWHDHLIIHVDPDYEYPAGVWTENGIRHMRIQPGYLNPGVIAHEQAHNSYDLMSDAKKVGFKVTLLRLYETRKVLKKLFKYNTYGLNYDGSLNFVEAHAEIYRYLYEQMPVELKGFYPRLM